ncbi:hypothetical protein FOZ63_012502, partial [Perkinsus olseni]
MSSFEVRTEEGRLHGAQTPPEASVSPRNVLDVNTRLRARFVDNPEGGGSRAEEEIPPAPPQHPTSQATSPPATAAQSVGPSVPAAAPGARSSQPQDNTGVQACANPPVSASDFSISGGEVGFKPPELALYSGEKAADAMSLDEWQPRWCSIARSKNWTPKEERSNLNNSLTGKAYRLLSKQSFDPSLDDEAVEREIWLRLHRSFGQGEKQSFRKLIAMQFCVGKDTVDCYGADIRHNSVSAFKAGNLHSYIAVSYI